jgi:hypothetical protein
VFLHAEECERYVETAGYPAELLRFGVVLDGYDAKQMIRRRETVADGSQEATIQEMMCDPLIRYVMVRDAEAGCFDLRVEKGNGRSLRDDRQRETTADPCGMTNKRWSQHTWSEGRRVDG